MNFQKLMLIVIPLAILIVAWQYFSRVDHTDPRQVATAFTKAVKAGDMKTASAYFVPEGLAAWQEEMGRMKSGATERLNERLPDDPDFTAPLTAPDGTSTISSADKTFTLVMKQLDGKWYVARAP